MAAPPGSESGAPPLPPRPNLGAGPRLRPQGSRDNDGWDSGTASASEPRPPGRKPAPPPPPTGARPLAYQPRQPRQPRLPPRTAAGSPARSTPSVRLDAGPAPAPAPASASAPLPLASSDDGVPLRERTGRLLAMGENYLASRDWRALGSSAKSRLGGLWHGQQPPLASSPVAREDRPPSALTNTNISASTSTSASAAADGNGNGTANASLANETTPILLPGFALAYPHAQGSELALSIYCHGLVLRIPQTPGTKQKIFNTMARQMAGIPKAPQLTPATTLSAPPSLPSSRSASQPDLFDAPLVDEPEPELEPADEPESKQPAQNQYQAQAQAQAQGQTPTSKRLSALQRLSTLPAKAEAAWLGGGAGTHTGLVPGQVTADNQGSGSPWAGRPAEELQVLRSNLEVRLHDFWSYRVDWCPITVELMPVLRRPPPAEGAPALPPPRPRGSPLLAITSSRAGSGGVFELTLSVSRARREEFMRKVYPGHSWEEVEGLRVRVVLGSSEGKPGVVQPSAAGKATPWMDVQLSEDRADSVRVVSDIDDTLKRTGVTAGMRTVFQNVFVRPYREVLVPHTPDWLNALARHGVGVHYLSNAPNELHTVVLDFLSTNQFPRGHVHLKDYPSGAFDLISSWLEPAGERKRPGLNRILRAFPLSQFILVGDSGELDLDIYTSIAMEHPTRIRGIYIRDVHSASALANRDAVRVARLLAQRNRRLGFKTSYDAHVLGLDSPSDLHLPETDEPWPPLVENYPLPSSKFSNLLSTLPPPYGTAPPLLPEGDVPGDDSAPVATPRRRSPPELFYLRIRRAVELLPEHTLLTVFAQNDPVPCDEALDLVQRVQQQAQPLP